MNLQTALSDYTTTVLGSIGTLVVVAGAGLLVILLVYRALRG